MVKIKIKFFLLGVFILMLFINTVNAARPALQITNVDVKVGSRVSRDLHDGDSVDRDAKPGDALELRVEVANNYTTSEDLEIQDIVIEGVVEGIDNGDDLDESSNEFNLAPGRTRKITLKYEIPLLVDEGSFDIIITAEGDDENSTSQNAEVRLSLNVEKESNLLKITRADLNPVDVSCKRKNIQFASTVINIGNDDQEDVKLQLLSQDLGLDKEDTVDLISAGVDEADSTFSKIYSFSIPDTAEAGTYPITFRAIYDNDRKRTEQTVTLNVQDCGTNPNTGTNQTGQKNEAQNLPTTTTTQPSESKNEIQIPPGTVVTQESSLTSSPLIIGIIFIEILLVIVGIVVLAFFFRRKD